MKASIHVHCGLRQRLQRLKIVDLWKIQAVDDQISEDKCSGPDYDVDLLQSTPNNWLRIPRQLIPLNSLRKVTGKILKQVPEAAMKGHCN